MPDTKDVVYRIKTWIGILCRIYKSLEKFGKRKELFELMFNMPYMKIDQLVKNGIAHRETASIYLKQLEKVGLLKTLKIGKSTYYINHRLMELLAKRDKIRKIERFDLSSPKQSDHFSLLIPDKLKRIAKPGGRWLTDPFYPTYDDIRFNLAFPSDS